MREPCISREYGAHARRIPGTRAALPCARRSGKPEVLARAAEAAQNGPLDQIRSGAGARYLSWVAVTKEELDSASATGKHNTVRVPISDVS